MLSRMDDDGQTEAMLLTEYHRQPVMAWREVDVLRSCRAREAAPGLSYPQAWLC